VPPHVPPHVLRHVLRHVLWHVPRHVPRLVERRVAVTRARLGRVLSFHGGNPILPSAFNGVGGGRVSHWLRTVRGPRRFGSVLELGHARSSAETGNSTG